MHIKGQCRHPDADQVWYIYYSLYRKYTITSGGQCTNADVSGFRCVNRELGCVLRHVNYNVSI